MMFQNTVLGAWTSGERTRIWRKLLNEEPYNVYSSPNIIIMMMKSKGSSDMHTMFCYRKLMGRGKPESGRRRRQY
jgi:hypothetical protein